MSSSKKTSFFQSSGWKNGMKYLYGWGAAVVIVGALFKILHLPGANEMLIVGLGTEAVIFFFSAFEPLPAEETHWEWNKVFPQLNEDVDPVIESLDMMGGGGKGAGLNIDTKALETANKTLTSELFEGLAASVKGLKTSVDSLAQISDATLATNDYTAKVKEATVKMDGLTKGYATTADAMSKFSDAVNVIKNSQEAITKDVQSYQSSVQSVTKNLTSLNAVYEVELQDTQKHMSSVKNYYGSIATVMKNLQDTTKDTEQLRQEVANLSKNLHSLNTIYGNMLTAMTSSLK